MMDKKGRKLNRYYPIVHYTPQLVHDLWPAVSNLPTVQSALSNYSHRNCPITRSVRFADLFNSHFPRLPLTLGCGSDPPNRRLRRWVALSH